MFYQTLGIWMSSETGTETVSEAVGETVAEVTSFGSTIGKWFATNWPNFIVFGIILVGGWILSSIIIKILKHFLKKTKLEKSSITFISSMAKYFLRFLVIILSLHPFGVEIVTVFSALGAAGLGLSLGLKESVGHLASGIQIIATKPFISGDYISVNNIEGTVERVEIMYTCLRNLDNHEVVIPNSILTANAVTNYTKLGVRRVTINFDVPYGSDLDNVRQVVLDICKNHPKTLDEPKSYFVVNGQGENGVKCSLRSYAKPEDYWPVFWEINESISNAAKEHKFLIPYPQMDIHFYPGENEDLIIPNKKKSSVFHRKETNITEEP